MAAIQTYKSLQDKVLRYLDEAGDTSTTLALVKDALNTANTKRATQEKWPFMLWDTVELLTVTSGRQTYTLHPEYFRASYFWNRTQQDYVTQEVEGTLPTSGIDRNVDTAAALQFLMEGRAEVSAQPASASVLTLASSTTADNGSRSVVIRGNTADGPRTESITCGGSGTVAFTKILKCTKVGTWVGTLSLTAGSTTLLTLFPEEAGRSYQQISFLALPSGDEVIDYRFYRLPIAMSYDEDRPEIPTPFEDLLTYDALLYFASYNQYDAGVVNRWEREQSELLLALQQSYSDDSALEARTRYIGYVSR